MERYQRWQRRLRLPHTFSCSPKWTYSKFTKESFEDYVARTHTSDIQSVRGKKSKGGGRPSLNNIWDVLGISRRTFFRKKTTTCGRLIERSSRFHKYEK